MIFSLNSSFKSIDNEISSLLMTLMLMIELHRPEEMIRRSENVDIFVIGELNSLKYLYNCVGGYSLRCCVQKKSLCTKISYPIVVPITMYL